MMTSKIEYRNGRAELVIDGVREPAMAYITYFDEHTHCADFAKVGYKLFSVGAAFTGLPINPRTGFTPACGPGIFDVKDKPDYRAFEENVRAIIAACPDARIFPRVYVSMPQWWVDENPDEVCTTKHGDRREALYSRKFRQTGAEFLREFIAHVHASDYSEHIIGYQIAGGATQEWFHFDSNGSRSPCTERCFREYTGNPSAKVPDHSLADVSGLIAPEMQIYLEFISFEIANTVAYFAKTVKECVGYRQIVGAFYGYSQSMFRMFEGNIGASVLLNCPDVDFFCAPNAYFKNRALGFDWGDLCAGESIRAHKKLYFVENDIRTCFTDYPGNIRDNVDPWQKYNTSVWLGPPTMEQSVWAVQKAFARQFTHSNAMWWFDMWGGWYASPELMGQMETFLRLAAENLQANTPATRSQVVVLCDEKLPFRLGSKDPCVEIQQTVRDTMGATGIPSDALIMEDYRECVHYDAVLIPFPADFDTEETRNAKAFLRKQGIPYVQLTRADSAIDAADLRGRLVDIGAHCYCDTGDVIYCGNGLLAIHAATAGEKTINLPRVCKLQDLTTGETQTTHRLLTTCQEFETKLFILTP